MSHKVDEDGCKFEFTADDNGIMMVVDAWVEKLPGQTLEDKTEAAAKAVSKVLGREVKLQCRYASGSDYRWIVV